jgi:HEAT repeat protein
MNRLTRLSLLAVAVLAAARPVAAQPLPFEDVVRNLRNPDPEIRISAVRLLQQAGHREAIVPMAPLVTDPVNEIQLEAIGAELSFFLVEPVPAKKRVALVVEVRSSGQGGAAFQRGPLAAWPTPAPPELVSALLKAVDDENKKVRLEAIYTLGVVARGPLAGDSEQQLVKALDHYDPEIRAGAARVIGRLRMKSASDALFKAINDSSADVRHAAMRALGEIGEMNAVQALTDQFKYYAKGAGAWAALDALARLAHPSSAPLFKAHLADRDPYLRRASAEGLGRLGDASEMSNLQEGVNNDESEMVRAAMAFALQKTGRNFVMRLVDMLDSDSIAPQVQGYLMELGPPVADELIPRLQEPDASVRRHVAEVLGAIGSEGTIVALTPLQKDGDRDVVKAANQAIERIRLSAK